MQNQFIKSLMMTVIAVIDITLKKHLFSAGVSHKTKVLI